MQKILNVKIQIENYKKKNLIFFLTKALKKKEKKKRDLDEFNQNIHCSFRVDDFCRN